MVMQRSLRVLIVDDEPLGRQRIEDLVRKDPSIEIAGTAADGTAAVQAIRTLRPDLVFLDVQMPGMTGLDVIRELGPDEMPATVLVTAYDKHALEAFELAAVDYVVKPFDDERLEEAIKRARRLVGVRGVGFLLDGFYYVQRVTHRIKKGEYKQSFSLVREGLGAIAPVVVP